jgi:hypothetical protein
MYVAAHALERQLVRSLLFLVSFKDIVTDIDF